MAKSVVSIVKGTDAEKMVEEALDLLGGVSSLIKPNSVVVVKPNAGHPVPPDYSGCTSPEMVAAVIKVIRKANPKEIIVAESGASGCDTMECFEVSGIGKAARDAGADRLIDIKRELDLINIPIRDARSAVTKIALPRFLLEADHIVNVPIFKPHCAMVFTCALKNIKGVVQDKIHHQMHLTDLAAAMMDVWSVIKPDLSIADLIRPGEGFGEQSGIGDYFGCVVASKDPVALDATACRMVDLDIKKVTYFKPAQERGFGNYREDRIEIRGKTIAEVFKPVWMPYLGGFDQWPEYCVDSSGSCSSCQGLTAYSLERLKQLGEYDKNAGVTVLLGPKKSLPKGVKPRDLILVGECLKKYSDQGVFVKGCPPGGGGVIAGITTRADAKGYGQEKDLGPGQYEITRTALTSAASVKGWREYQKKMKEKWLQERQSAKTK